jgi:hypothetical protein
MKELAAALIGFIIAVMLFTAASPPEPIVAQVSATASLTSCSYDRELAVEQMRFARYAHEELSKNYKQRGEIGKSEDQQWWVLVYDNVIDYLTDDCVATSSPPVLYLPESYRDWTWPPRE